MKKRFIHDTRGSINPVLIFLICLGVASFLVLIFGEVLSPFFQLSNSDDSDIATEISTPRHYMNILFDMVWPKGVLIGVFLGLSLWVLMDYQKKRYKEA